MYKNQAILFKHTTKEGFHSTFTKLLCGTINYNSLMFPNDCIPIYFLTKVTDTIIVEIIQCGI